MLHEDADASCLGDSPLHHVKVAPAVLAAAVHHVHGAAQRLAHDGDGARELAFRHAGPEHEHVLPCPRVREGLDPSHAMRVHGHLRHEVGVGTWLHPRAVRADRAEGNLRVGGVGREHALHGAVRSHAHAQAPALGLHVGPVRGRQRHAGRERSKDVLDLKALVARGHGKAAAVRPHARKDRREALTAEVLAAQVQEGAVLVGHHEPDRGAGHRVLGHWVSRRPFDMP